ncbi:hypothetical protein ES703_58355 [subsurface metagenome]
MPKYEIGVSAYFTLEFDQKPSEGDVIAALRVEPAELLSALEIDSIDEV